MSAGRVSKLGYTGTVAARLRYPLAVTLPAEVLAKPAAPPRLGFPFRLLLILGVLPLLLAASILAIYRQQQTDRIYTGVRVFGLDLSRMRYDEAAGALRVHLRDASRRRFELRYDDDVISVSLGAMGLAADEAEVAALVDRAWMVGRDDDLRAWLSDQLVLLRHGFDVPATVRFDRERASSVLGGITADVERVTLNANLSVARAGDRFEVHTSPAQTGRRLNVNATLDRLQKSLVGTLPGHVDLVLEEAPPGIADADLVPARDAIEVLLGSALQFRDGARSWALDPPAAFEMLDITGLSAGRPPIGAKLNDDKLAAFVEKTARAADQPAENPTFAIENSRVVVKPGRTGKVADAAKTFEPARERSLSPATPRVVEMVFAEDRPWLSLADLEPFRARADALLEQPLTIETPALPGVAEKRWTLTRTELAQMMVLPSTLNTPREYATLPAAQRPQYELFLDSGLIAGFLGREVAPWVSEDPVDATLELLTTRVDAPNPAYAAAVAAEQRRLETSSSAGDPVPGATVSGSGTDLRAAAAARVTLPATVQENRYRVGLRNARDGRGPDYNGTFAAVQALFRSTSPAAPEERRVTVRLAPRPPRVSDLDLARARDEANQLIDQPVTLRWKDATWTVSRDELVGMLRYQPGRDGKLTAYLTRDALLTRAGAIAREADRRPDAPRASDGSALPADVAQIAGVIWQLASTARDGARAAEVVWTEDLTQPAAPATPTPAR